MGTPLVVKPAADMPSVAAPAAGTSLGDVPIGILAPLGPQLPQELNPLRRLASSGSRVSQELGKDLGSLRILALGFLGNGGALRNENGHCGTFYYMYHTN